MKENISSNSFWYFTNVYGENL